jgi:hypothetical protein
VTDGVDASVPWQQVPARHLALDLSDAVAGGTQLIRRDMSVLASRESRNPVSSCLWSHTDP